MARFFLSDYSLFNKDDIMHIDTFVSKVCDDLNSGDKTEVFVDPATILLISKIIYELVKAIKACKRSKESVKASAQNPSLLETFIINRTIRRHARKSTPAERTKIREKILNNAANLSEEEIENVLNS